MIEKLKQVLEALRECNIYAFAGGLGLRTTAHREALAILEKAIAELESQEQPLPPVEIGVDVTADGASVVALYRRPNAVMEVFYSQFHPTPQRTWVGLSDEDIDHIYTGVRAVHHDINSYVFCQAIEAKLKEKNS